MLRPRHLAGLCLFVVLATPLRAAFGQVPLPQPSPLTRAVDIGSTPLKPSLSAQSTQSQPTTRKNPLQPQPPEDASAALRRQIAAPAAGGSGSGDNFVFVVDQDLKSFIADFCQRIGMRVDIDSGVRGRLSGLRLPVDPPALLDELGARHGIEWYMDGDVLNISARSDMATKILPLQGVEYQALQNEIRTLNLGAGRYPIRNMNDGASVLVKGPAKYVGRIAALIEAMRRGSDNSGGINIVRFGHEQRLPLR